MMASLDSYLSCQTQRTRCICLHVVLFRVSRGNEHTLRAEELSRDVESLAADDNDLLAAQQLLGNNAGKTTEKVALAVNDDLVDTQMVSTLSTR